jgi:hypothetical protein
VEEEAMEPAGEGREEVWAGEVMEMAGKGRVEADSVAVDLAVTEDSMAEACEVNLLLQRLCSE